MTLTTMDVLLGHAKFILIIWCGVLALESKYLKRKFRSLTSTKVQNASVEVKCDTRASVKISTRICS